MPSARELSAAWITVVAEQAALIGKTREIGGCGVVEPGTHPPASFLRVPGDGQFGEFAARGLVQVRTRMVARSDGEGRLLLECVRFRAARIQLIPSLENAAIAFQHLIVTSGLCVEDVIIALVIFDWGCLGRG